MYLSISLPLSTTCRDEFTKTESAHYEQTRERSLDLPVHWEAGEDKSVRSSRRRRRVRRRRTHHHRQTAMQIEKQHREVGEPSRQLNCFPGVSQQGQELLESFCPSEKGNKVVYDTRFPHDCLPLFLSLYSAFFFFVKERFSPSTEREREEIQQSRGRERSRVPSSLKAEKNKPWER